ncbi:DUF5606 domain-containing protein [Pedobacter sp. SD-b]|uniref:DUF5606 domain-containing protein n=1 Tax=Pedobacter segetis TaxID=2793069 RepID=A0ABS1BGB8_9SPHI|nr:DUF5606 domain-containing protein [Pedobacter segetis]MBK0381888.1 DUF5606 domain-containing protein [Pedobacter segetis]
MNLAGLVAVSGKPGLYKLIGQNKSGYILESLDDAKSKTIVNISTAKLASLDDITIYGNDEDLRLKDVFEKMKAAKEVPDAKADGKVLRAFFFEVAADHDEQRVYSSDIKKIVSWFHLLKDMPLFSEKEAKAELTEDAEKTSDIKETRKEIKVAKPKAATAKPKNQKVANTKSAAVKKTGGSKTP